MNNIYRTPRTDWALLIGTGIGTLWVIYLLAKEFIRCTN